MAANLYKCLLLLRCPIKEGAGQKRHLNATFAAIMTIAKGPLPPVVLFFFCFLSQVRLHILPVDHGVYPTIRNSSSILFGLSFVILIA